MSRSRDPVATPPAIDLDAASSEPLHPAARETLLAALEQGYADPRRLHRSGRSARLLLDNARAVVAESLGVRPDEVSFTGSGTEAVHRGLLGLVRGHRAGTGEVVHAAVEHAAVRHAVAWGGEPSRCPSTRWVGSTWTRSGRRPHGRACRRSPCRRPTTRWARCSRWPSSSCPTGVPLFTDACASMGRLPLPSGWDAAAGSAHKWGGPAGVGVLLVRKGARWRNPFPGDDRVDERVAGFENVPGALAAAAALQAVVAEREETSRRQAALVARIREQVARIPDVEVVGDPDRRLPHLVTFSCLYLDGEALVHRWSGPASVWPAGRPARRRRSSPAPCSPRWAPSPTATSGCR